MVQLEKRRSSCPLVAGLEEGRTSLLLSLNSVNTDSCKCGALESLDLELLLVDEAIERSCTFRCFRCPTVCCGSSVQAALNILTECFVVGGPVWAEERQRDDAPERRKETDQQNGSLP